MIIFIKIPQWFLKFEITDFFFCGQLTVDQLFIWKLRNIYISTMLPIDWNCIFLSFSPHVNCPRWHRHVPLTSPRQQCGASDLQRAGVLVRHRILRAEPACRRDVPCLAVLPQRGRLHRPRCHREVLPGTLVQREPHTASGDDTPAYRCVVFDLVVCCVRDMVIGVCCVWF